MVKAVIKKNNGSHRPHRSESEIRLKPGVSLKDEPVKTQTPFWPSLLLLLGIALVGWTLASYLHYRLPTVVTREATLQHPGLVSEERALEYVREIGDWYRIVGTPEHIEAEQRVLAMLAALEAEAKPYGAVMEVDHQIGDGGHRFDMMAKAVWKVFSASNIVVKLSCPKTSRHYPQCQENAVVVNAHLDSTLPTPGAADDMLAVAVQLELIRTLIQTNASEMAHSVIMLINNGEESLQDASVLFVTQHKWASLARTVINLEACGNKGPTLVFQATNDIVIQALHHAPSPFATVLANDIFSSGVLLSDTDFRQFVQYGGYGGIDQAVVSNSYAYHTGLDIVKNIGPGTIQHMAANTQGVLRYLLSSECDLARIGESEAWERKGGPTIFFSALGGSFYVAYKWNVAVALHLTFIAGALGLVIFTSKRPIQSLKGGLICATSQATSLLGSIVAANIQATVMRFVLRKPLTFFAGELRALLLYGPSAFLGYFSAQVFFRYLINKLGYAKIYANLERHTLVGQMFFFALLTGLGTIFELGSIYLMFLALANSLIWLTLEALLTSSSYVPLWLYCSTALFPAMVGADGLITILDIFVPLVGRLGADVPADHVIATVVAAVGPLCVPWTLAWSHRYPKAYTPTLAVLLLAATASSAIFATMVPVFDAEHPKRLFMQHVHDLSTGLDSMWIAQADGGPGYPELIEIVEKAAPVALGTASYIRMNESINEWNVLYPFSQFLDGSVIPLGNPAGDTFQPQDPLFSVLKNTLNRASKARSVTVQVNGNGLIWSTLAFNASLLAWSLPSPPDRGMHHHVIKRAANYGRETFSLDLEIQLSREEFELELAQGTEGGAGSHKIQGTVVGLVQDGFYPNAKDRGGHLASVQMFGRIAQGLPPWVQPMMVSAIHKKVEF